MEAATDNPKLTPALEDYLETLWEILQHKKVAQISEVAERRNVNVTSVTPAMKRLKKMGLVDYVARAYVDLTPAGIDVARKIKSRHDLIKRFLVEILGVSHENAAKDACSAEHMFSDETIDRLVRFFEYIQRCDATETQFLKRYLNCSVVHPDNDGQVCTCSHAEKLKKQSSLPPARYLSRLSPGESATVLQVVAEEAMRHSLIDRGMISGKLVKLIRIDPDGEPVWVKIGTDEVTLSMREAASILVSD
eukprot:Anaeramoba_ignava/a607566_12.p1 GENE.a607566_12~~a607566_12.p1  ORF type:complete len:249 (-),score=-25.10 a607566_12:7-753(-)